MTLFRQEVLEARSKEWMGTIRLAPPRAGWAFLTAGVAAVSVFCAILVFGHYTRREPVPGRLVSDHGLIEVAPLTAARVLRVLVKEGAHVEPGQPVLVLSGEQSSTQMGSIPAVALEQLKAAEETLKVDRVAQERTQDVKEVELHQQLAALHAQSEQMTGEIGVETARRDSAKSLYDKWADIAASGIVSKTQLLEQRDRYLGIESALHELRRQQQALQQQIAQVESQVRSLPAQRSLQQNDIARRQGELTRAMAQAEAEHETVLTAPAAGEVASLLAFPGQSAAARQPLIHILPAGAELQAELWVPSRAAGFLRTEKPVSLRYTAYPYEMYGQGGGRVTAVSGSAIGAEEVSRALGQPVAEARYRVVVALSSQYLQTRGAALPLKPGMLIDADVALDRRRLIDFLLEPFRRSMGAFHDGVRT